MGTGLKSSAHIFNTLYRTHVKRLVDITVGSTALLLSAAILIPAGLIIKATSKGSPIFSQIRVGKNGKLFKMYKLRTMISGSEALKKELEILNEAEGPVFKIKDDPRVTRIGKLLRKYSLDELPQLVNIVKGDMSIVGPRPPVPSEVANYEPHHHERLTTLPGLTCSWQISSRNFSFNKWVELDVEYIKGISALKDLEIIVNTAKYILKGSNS